MLRELDPQTCHQIALGNQTVADVSRRIAGSNANHWTVETSVAQADAARVRQYESLTRSCEIYHQAVLDIRKPSGRSH